MKFERGDLARITTGGKIGGTNIFVPANSPAIIAGPSEELNGWFRVYFPTYSIYGLWPRSGLARLQEKGGVSEV